MLRPLAILAGLVLIALVVFLFTRERVVAPVSSLSEETSIRPEDRRADPLSSDEAAARDAAAPPIAPDANYVSIVGALTREEDARQSKARSSRSPIAISARAHKRNSGTCQSTSTSTGSSSRSSPSPCFSAGA